MYLNFYQIWFELLSKCVGISIKSYSKYFLSNPNYIQTPLEFGVLCCIFQYLTNFYQICSNFYQIWFELLSKLVGISIKNHILILNFYQNQTNQVFLLSNHPTINVLLLNESFSSKMNFYQIEFLSN